MPQPSNNPSIADRIAFCHASLFSRALSTWCDAIDAGHIATWPALASAQVQRHPPALTAMIKGRLCQRRANVRSTKPRTNADLLTTTQQTPEEIQDLKPRVNDRETAVIKTASLSEDCQPAIGQICADPAGPLLVPSNSGNQRVLTLHQRDSIFICVDPVPSRTKEAHLAAHQCAIALFKS